LFPESEKRRARAGEDLALAFFLADRDPLWAVVALFYGVHHLLIALSLERAPGPFTPRKYSEALSLFRQAGLAKEVRKAYDKKSFRSLPSSKSTRLAKRLSERPRL
jgi:hypothetical protein